MQSLKTLVIKIFRELIQYAKRIREEMKATLSEIKKNPQGTNSEGKETGTQINYLEHKEEINIQPEQNEKKKKKKNSKKQGENKMTLTHLQKYQHQNHRDARTR